MKNFIALDRSIFSNPLLDQQDRRYTRRLAFMWLFAFGPVPKNYRHLAREWKWASPAKARNFVQKLLGAGLVVFDGEMIFAVDPKDARPNPCDGSWRIVREAVLARDNYTCVYCGSNDCPSADHVIPRSRGGTHTMDNLVTACKPCNSSKRDKTPEEWSR